MCVFCVKSFPTSGCDIHRWTTEGRIQPMLVNCIKFQHGLMLESVTEQMMGGWILKPLFNLNFLLNHD